jgi:hypothetical protein
MGEASLIRCALLLAGFQVVSVAQLVHQAFWGTGYLPFVK